MIPKLNKDITRKPTEQYPSLRQKKKYNSTICKKGNASLPKIGLTFKSQSMWKEYQDNSTGDKKLFQQMTLGWLDSHMWKNEVGPQHHVIYKNSLKMYQKSNRKS